MDKSVCERMLKMLSSPNDTDAVLALRSLERLFEQDGVSLAAAVTFAALNIDKLRKSAPAVIDNAPAAKVQAPVNISGMPECRVAREGCIEIVIAGKSGGEVVPLPAAAAAEAADIALHLKDALAAAVIQKSRFRLKLLDVKNARGEYVETVLQAEYDRPDMAPVRVWVNVKGEVAALAAVLRRAVANSVPELVAA